MQVIIVGSANAALFTEVVTTIYEHVPGRQVRCIPAVREIGPSPRADLIVVLQLWPDEYTPGEAVRLIDAAPLARLVVCYGPWCDSDGRTRSVWPPAARVPAASARSRLLQEIESLHRNRSPLPLTADRAEVFLRDHAFPPTRVKPLRVLVISPDGGLREALEALLTSAGLHSTGRGDGEADPAADVLLWDADPWDDGARLRLAELRSRRPVRPLVAMCGFSRPQVEREIRAAGAWGVVLKHAGLDALSSALELAADSAG